jgi:hypothetical protein
MMTVSVCVGVCLCVCLCHQVCAPGSGSSSGSLPCNICEVNTWSDGLDKAACVQCDANTKPTTAQAGSTAQTDCGRLTGLDFDVLAAGICADEW